MTALDLFTYDDEIDIRVITADGDIWFVAGDVAAALGYSATSAMTRSMDDDEKGVQILHTPGGDQSVTVISEPGLYEAILRSRIPAAIQFKRWVKRDVLPQIRRTGGYVMPTGIDKDRLALLAIESLQESVREAEAKVAELASPAAAWNALSNADGDFTITDAAKILGRDGQCPGPRQMFAWLESKGWIFRRGGRWQAMQAAVNAGFMVERVTSGYFDQVTGERKQAKPEVRVTAKGLQRMRDLLAEERTLTLVDGGSA